MITFAIPYYSKPEYLKLAIESVLKQTRSDWKLLVCDDCGPESREAKDLVESYRDPRIRYFRNETNLGLGGNWNRCLELADTDLVTLLHADDVLMPNYAETMLAAAARWTEASAIFCRSHVIDSQGKITFSVPDLIKRFLIPSEKAEFVLSGEAGVAALLRGNFIMCPTLCYRKPALGGRRFRPELRIVLDLEFTTRILLEGGTLVGVPEKAYDYRRHPTSTSAQGTADMAKFREEFALYDALARRCEEKAWGDAARIARRKTILNLQVAFFALRDLLHCRWQAGTRKLGFLAKRET